MLEVRQIFGVCLRKEAKPGGADAPKVLSRKNSHNALRLSISMIHSTRSLNGRKLDQVNSLDYHLK